MARDTPAYRALAGSEILMPSIACARLFKFNASGCMRLGFEILTSASRGTHARRALNLAFKF
ncbi:MAG: hypothetical protein ACLVCW_07675 [Campylobacter sp.]